MLHVTIGDNVPVENVTQTLTLHVMLVTSCRNVTQTLMLHVTVGDNIM